MRFNEQKVKHQKPFSAENERSSKSFKKKKKKNTHAVIVYSFDVPPKRLTFFISKNCFCYIWDNSKSADECCERCKASLEKSFE